VVCGVFGLWLGSILFSYFTYNAAPEVQVVGVESGGCYKGAVACSVDANNGYKISTVTVLVDGVEVDVDGASVRSKKFSLPFDVDTVELSDGEHIMTVESVDASYSKNKSSQEIEFFVDNKGLKAAILQPEYKVLQGRTLHPKVQINKEVASAKVRVFSGVYDCYPDGENSTVYEAFIPVDCEQYPESYIMSLEIADKVGNVVTLAGSAKVMAAEFPKQKGFYVAPEKLSDEREISMNNKILDTALEKWLENTPKKKMWRGAFEKPTVIKRLSTPYGEIRITPEKGRYLHRAIDIVNTPKSVIWASQNGKVIIKDRYLFSGNTVVIDHGLGVFTKYFHLEDFADIEVGDVLKKGSPVGTLGMTGYANGYHLHWELTINGVAVDPLEWTKSVY